MKTLYININNEQIQSNEELEVLKHDLDSDFFFYLGEKIAKNCKVENENALITDFNTKDNEEDYKQIITQWNEIKAVLFSEDCEGKIEFTLPNGYIHWLRYSEKYNHVYDKNFSHGEPFVIYIDLKELYKESVKDLQRKILRKLQRDDLYLEIDEIVFNDDAVTIESPIIRTIKEIHKTISIISLKEQLERERLEKERLEKERLEKERLEKERLEKEQLEEVALLNPEIQNNEEFFYYYLLKEKVYIKNIDKKVKSKILREIRLYLNNKLKNDSINLTNVYNNNSIYADPASPFYGGNHIYNINIQDKYRLNFFLFVTKSSAWNEEQIAEICVAILSMFFPLKSSCIKSLNVPMLSHFNRRYKYNLTIKYSIYTYDDGTIKVEKIN